MAPPGSHLAKAVVPAAAGLLGAAALSPDVIRGAAASLPEGLTRGFSPDLITVLIGVPLRGALFYLSLFVIVAALVRAFAGDPLWHEMRQPRIRVAGAIACVALAALMWPLRDTFVAHLGGTYARMSLDPFAFEHPLFAHRILLPAVGHLLQAKGHLLYWLFSMVQLAGLVWLLAAFVGRLWPMASRSEHVLATVSLATCSFVMTALAWPGYADTMLMIAALVVLLTRPSDSTVLLLAVLTLSAHELGTVPLGAALLARRRWSAAAKTGTLTAAYLLVVFAVEGRLAFFFTAASPEANVEFATANTGWILAGIATAYKVLWVVPLYTTLRGGRAAWWPALNAGLIMLLPIPLIAIGTDTTRLAGFGAAGLLMAIECFAAVEPSARVRNSLFLVNVAIPSVGFTSQFGPYVETGLYALIAGLA